MRSNRLRSYIAVAAIIVGTSTAYAQDTDEDADGKTDHKAAPAEVAQAEPQPPTPPMADQPGSAGPTNPGSAAPAPMTEEQLRKMVEEQIAKSRKGISIEFGG